MREFSTRQRVLWIVGGALIILYCLFPVAWLTSLSFKAPADLTNRQFLPTEPSTENYEQILPGGSAADLFMPALRNSIGIALILTSALAVAIFPVVSIVTPLFNLWRNIGLYDTWPGLIIPYLSLTLPLSIWTMSAFFREIPWEMEQAAQVDGATSWQAFRRVIVPLAAPGVFTTAIISFFIAWNDFVYGISLTSTSAARPVPAALSFFTGESQFVEPTGAISAAAIIVTIPVVVLVLIFQRRIVAGLTNGAVKG